MKIIRNLLYILAFFTVTYVGFNFLASESEYREQKQPAKILEKNYDFLAATSTLPTAIEKRPEQEIKEITATEKTPIKSAETDTLALQKVEFTSQAPTGNWADLRQEDGCEEASVLMAVTWAQKKQLPKGAEAEKKIIAISDWEKKNYGEYRDTSIEDTASRIMEGFFGFKNYFLKNNVKIDDLKYELSKGNIIVAPMDGRALKNPNFKAPGPEHHMIVIIGYDPVKKEFITNDPGTRKGASYRYSEKIIDQALRNYPTGSHLKAAKVEKKIIVVKPE